jgi:hypothetical protein
VTQSLEVVSLTDTLPSVEDVLDGLSESAGTPHDALLTSGSRSIDVVLVGVHTVDKGRVDDGLGQLEALLGPAHVVADLQAARVLRYGVLRREFGGVVCVGLPVGIAEGLIAERKAS